MNQASTTTDIDLSAFHPNTVGLPDRNVLGSDGKPSEEVLQKRLGFSRKYRRFLASNKKKFSTLGLYGNRKARAQGFCYQAKTYRKLRRDFLSAGDDRISWETLVFQEFIPGWHLIIEGDESGEPIDSLVYPEEHRGATLKKRFKTFVGSEATTNVFLSVVPVFDKLLIELKEWKNIDEDKRALLADVAFGIFTLFGPDALQEIVTEQPAVLNYYRQIIQTNSKKPSIQNLDREGPNSKSQLKVDSPNVVGAHPDLISFYKEVFNLSAYGIANYTDVSVADRLENLILTQLPKLRKSAFLSDDEVKSIIQRFIQEVLETGRKTKLDYFFDVDFEKAFKNTWILHLQGLLSVETSPTFFTDELARINNMEPLISEIEEARKSLNITRQKIAELLTSFEKASLGLRLELKVAIASERTKEAQISQALNVSENQLIVRFLPPGVTMAGMAENSMDIELQPSLYHKSVAVALRNWGEELRSEAQEKNQSLPAEKSPAESVIVSDQSEDDVKVLSEGPHPLVQIDEAIIPDSDPKAGPSENSFPESPDIELEPKEQFPVANDSIKAEADTIADKADFKNFVNSSIELAASSESESPEPIINVPQKNADASDILAEVYPSEYEEDAYLACERVTQCFKNRGIISHVHAENIALHWLKKGHLNAAFITLTVAQSLDFLEGDVIAPAILRAAYFGQNVWPGDLSAVSTIQRELNFLSPQQIEELMARRPGGKVLPYLLFTATLQPALFAGHYTSAPQLLRQIGNEFEEATKKLINEVVSFANQGNHLDLEALRKQPIVDERNHKAKLLTRLADWRDRIVNKQTGWAPARMAMSNCLKRPEFARVITIIESGSPEGRSIVQEFIDLYSEQSAVTSLMEKEVEKAREGYNDVAVIERNALYWFQNSVSEFREIATSWLLDSKNNFSRTDGTQAFASRFVNQLRAVQTELQRYSNLTSSFEHSCGMLIAQGAVSNLLKAIDGDVFGMWESKRALAHFNLPSQLIEGDGISPDDFQSQFFWLVEHCETGFDEKSFAQSAIASKEFSLARLLLLSLSDRGVDVNLQLQDLDKQAAEARRGLAHEAQQIKVMVDNAVLSALIDDDRGTQISAEIEYLTDTINKLDTLDSLGGLEDDLSLKRKDLEARFNEEVIRLQKEFDVLLAQARVQVGIEVVPDAWLDQMGRALKEKNIPVAVEMLEHLKTCIAEGVSVKVDEYGPNQTLNNFLNIQNKLFEFIVAHPDPREIGRLLSANPIEGVDFSASPGVLKKALETMAAWKSHPFKSLGKPQFDMLADVLDYLGFEVADLEFKWDTPIKIGFSSNRDFSHAFIPVKTSDTGRPFPFFEPDAKTSQITVILSFREWLPVDLKKYLDGLGLPHQRTILLSAISLSSENRNRFAAYSKAEQFSVFHVDPVMMAFIAAMPRQSAQSHRLRNFLLLSVPWTYFNPYTRQDTLRPAPAEMRYGLNNSVQKLTDMQGGAAIIYGGRQLGKSTMLHEAVRRFNAPTAHRHAFYIQMDKNIDRLKGLSKTAWEKARERVWGEIYNCLGQAKILRETPTANTDEMIQAVANELGRGGTESVLICFDEIDPILELDSANRFGIFRGLSDLVNKPNRRLKVVIAGLQNVKRFENAPNFPLPQLGSSIQVSILPTRDALHLVQEPLQILGYVFEDPLLVNRILVLTNRHPGLIHIFCHELVSWMARRQQNEVGKIYITHADVEKIAKEPIVQDLIRLRFNMTLNLDERYLVMVYGLINHNRSAGPFTSSQTKHIAEMWWPKAFRHLTERQFEAFLEELVGLGVLRFTKNEGRNEYFLRNANILNLLGNQRDIEENLLRAVESIDQHDPLSAHGFPENSACPSPLTLRDEKQLLSDDNSGLLKNGDKSVMYSVGIVTGSLALGLDPDHFLATLPSIGEFEVPFGKESIRHYKPKHYKDADFRGISDFKKQIATVIQEYSLTNPIMVLVSIGGRRPLSETLDMLDIAHELGDPAMRLKHRVRILFLLGPRALWAWESSPELTKSREAQQLFIGLDRWSNTALSHLLNRLGLQNTNAEVIEFKTYSDGWYYSVNILAQSKNRRPEVNRLSDFGEMYIPILECQPKDFDIFLSKTGLGDVPWGISLVKKILEQETFNLEDIQIALMEPEFEAISDLASEVLRWMERLHLVEPIDIRDPNKAILYKITPSIAAAVRSVRKGIKAAVS